MKRQAIALVLLQAADLATTHAGLAFAAHEANPVGMGLLAHGFPALVAAKAAGTLLILGMAWLLWRHVHRTQAVVALQVCCALMLAVVGWNSWTLQLH